MRKKISNFLLYIGLPILALIFLFKFDAISGNKPKEVEYSQIVNMVYNNEISEIEINLSNGEVEYILRGGDKKPQVCKVADPDYLHSDISEFIIQHNIENKENAESQILLKHRKAMNLSWVSSLITIACFVILTIFLMAKMGNMTKGVTKNDFGKNKVVMDKDSKVKFENVAGCEEEKEELEEIVNFLKRPQEFIMAGARIPKGVLLVGPPGTGKTLLAKAVAGEAGVPFFSISGSDFVEMFVGVGAQRVRGLFEQAKKNAPSIIFIDEIDAVGRQRGSGLGGGHDEREQTLNQLLVEMDGFAKNQNIIVMAATNRPDVLDKALLRAGRFDRQVVVNLPDVGGRKEILKIHAQNKKIDTEVDIDKLAVATAGYSGADIENLLNEAAILAVRDNRSVIKQKDIDDAMLKVLMGPEKKSHIIGDEDKKITAYHEAGHAIVAHYLPSQTPVEQISIIPRGMAAGFTLYKPQKDKEHLSKAKLNDDICALLAGRAAEEISQPSICTGASNDIKRATELARKMVTEWGMSSEVGTIDYSQESKSFLGAVASSKAYSEATAKKIDDEIKKIIDKAYNKAVDILEKNKSQLDKVAEVLIQKEKISGEEFLSIMKSDIESGFVPDLVPPQWRNIEMK